VGGRNMEMGIVVRGRKSNGRRRTRYGNNPLLLLLLDDSTML